MKKLFILFLIAAALFSGCKTEDDSGYLDYDDTDYLDDGEEIIEDATNGLVPGTKQADWLFICYMDGDNNLDTNINQDFNEMEYGLSLISDCVGMPGKEKRTVRAVVLLDRSGSGNTKVYELGSDSEVNAKVSTNTRDLTSYCNWITDNEVDMSSTKILAAFIKWVNNHYSGTRVILQISDHGSGPGAYTRAMFQDVTTNKNYMMSSGQFSAALSSAGYGEEKKFDLILMDMCFTASVEDLYEIRNFANYAIASPNVTPGAGFNYTSIISNTKNSLSTKSYGIKYVLDFEDEYKKSNKFYRYDSNGVRIYSGTGGSYNENQNWEATTDCGVISTITFVDLTKMDGVAQAINSLAGEIISSFNLREFLLYKDNKSRNAVCYKGSYSWLFDPGYFANKIINSNDASENAKNLALNVKDSLSEAIISSWRDSTFSEDKKIVSPEEKSTSISFYKYISNSENKLEKCMGLAICGGSTTSKTEPKNAVGPRNSWYTTDIAFGKLTGGWADMLGNWFGD